MPELHELEYATRAEDHEPTGGSYPLIVGLNWLGTVCAVLVFLLMVLTANDPYGEMLGFILGVPLLMGHLLIAALPAWSFAFGKGRRREYRRAMRKLLILSLLPFGLLLIGFLVQAVVVNTKGSS